MVDAEMFERADIQCVVALPTVQIDDAVRYHFALDDGNQRFARRVRDHARVNLSTTLKALPVNIVSSIPCRATRSQDIDDI